LVKIFDPILAQSGSRLLDGDSVSLLAACQALGDCDHNHLVKIAIERAERPIRSPRHVAAVCADALASWRKSGESASNEISRSDIDAMIQKEREVLEQKRKEARRK
jgi:hypothetical protein